MQTTVFLTLLCGVSLQTICGKSLESKDMICHTKNPADCYPHIFVPTGEFQVVHDDQRIPKGLHIRMNLETGVKEAKLYEEGPDDNVSAVEVFPAGQEQEGQKPIDEDHIPSEPFFQHVLQTADEGPIRPPVALAEDTTTYDANVATIRATFDAKLDMDNLRIAMENVENLSHDIYWGMKLVKDTTTIKVIYQFLNGESIDSSLKGWAARLLGTATQNSLQVLKELLSHRDLPGFPDEPLRLAMSALQRGLPADDATRVIYLLSALCQDEEQLLAFINADGLSLLQTMFDAPQAGQDDKDRLRGKIANFLLDRFIGGYGTRPLARFKNSTLYGEDSPSMKADTSLRYEEDPWVVTNAFAENYWPSTPPLAKAKYIHHAAELQKWCRPFEQSKAIWVKRGLFPPARDSVEEANVELEKRLLAYGINCDTEIHS